MSTKSLRERLAAAKKKGHGGIIVVNDELELLVTAADQGAVIAEHGLDTVAGHMPCRDDKRVKQATIRRAI